MRRIFVLIGCAGAAACGSSTLENPDEWTCEGLIGPVIEMSQERDVQVLEITDTRQRIRTYGPEPRIECLAGAEWSSGYGAIVYEARVTEGGRVILSYERQ